MEAYLKQIKELNNWLLTVWVPRGQDFEEAEMQAKCGPVHAQIQEWVQYPQKANMRFECMGGEGECKYDENVFNSYDKMTQELCIELYFMEEILGEKYNEDRIQMKFCRELKQKYGIN